jgi:L-threonylcarbamoyladenylate synthase
MFIATWLANGQLMNFQIRKAAHCLEAGGVIGYPTEGVYGIGCLPGYPNAIERVINIKGRRADAGLILIAADLELLDDWIAPTTAELANLQRSSHYPTTWIVTAQPKVHPFLTGGRNTLAVRVTDHPLAAALSVATGAPLVSTSANKRGAAPALSAFQTRLKLGKTLDYVISGPLGGASGPSEIRVAADNRVLRAAS